MDAGEVQYPPSGLFNSNHLQWVHKSFKKRRVDEAMIPVDRVGDFVRGEESSVKNNTRYSIRKTDDPEMRNGVKTVRYWCMYGPTDLRKHKIEDLPQERPPAEGIGSRLLRQDRRLGKSSLRGCRSHFQALYFKEKPSMCLLRWAERDHVDLAGLPCHGTEDPEAVDVHCDYAKHLSRDCLEFVRNYLRAGVAPRQIIEEHNKEIRAKCRDQSGAEKSVWKRDLQLRPKDVLNTRQIMRRKNGLAYSKHDHIATHTWIQNHPSHVLLYQPANSNLNVPFVLVWGTPWTFGNMAKLAQHRAISMDSTFASNVYERNKASCLVQVLQAVKDKMDMIRREDMGLVEPFVPSCFIVDDAKEEHVAIQAVFPTVPIILCLYHVRKSWLHQLYQKVKVRSHRVQLNKDLGQLMYAWHEEGEAELRSTEFMSKWEALQPNFIKYYRKDWHARLGWWVKQERKFNHNNQNTNGTIERWHRTLKAYLADERPDKKGRTISWLLWIIESKVELQYWVTDELKDQGRITNSVIQKQVMDYIYNAKLIPDEHVHFFDDGDLQCALVASVSTPGIVYELISYDKIHACCSCGDAIQGNLCKHQIKCLTLKGFSERQILYVLGSKMGTPFGGMERLHNLQRAAVCAGGEGPGPGTRQESIGFVQGGRRPVEERPTCVNRTHVEYMAAVQKFLPSVSHVPQLMNEAYHVLQVGFENIRELKAKLQTLGACSMSNIQEEHVERFESRPGARPGFSIACGESWVDRMHASAGMRRSTNENLQSTFPTELQPFQKNKPNKPKRTMQQTLEDELIDEQEGVQARRRKRDRTLPTPSASIRTPLSELQSNGNIPTWNRSTVQSSLASTSANTPCRVILSMTSTAAFEGPGLCAPTLSGPPPHSFDPILSLPDDEPYIISIA